MPEHLRQVNLENAKLLADEKDTHSPFYHQLKVLNDRILIYKQLYLNKQPKMTKDMNDQIRMFQIRKNTERHREEQMR